MKLKIGTLVDVQGRFFGRIVGIDDNKEYPYEARSLCGDITERCCETELYEPEEGLDEIDMMTLDSAIMQREV